LNSFDKNKTKFCEYKIKSQLIAFLLEAFTFIGGDIYLEFYYYSIFKLIYLFFLFFILIFQIPCKYCGLRDLLNYTCVPCVYVKTGTIVISIFGIITWEIADLIRIMSYRSVDKNNMPLDYFF
jgi:hypothetical protein